MVTVTAVVENMGAAVTVDRTCTMHKQITCLGVWSKIQIVLIAHLRTLHVCCLLDPSNLSQLHIWRTVLHSARQ